jgi:predicted RNA-binding Zn-ribbon protein involved in translation (DUF1610 family)
LNAETDSIWGLSLMPKSCSLCSTKASLRCDRCGNEFCINHAVKCRSCGMIICIRGLRFRTSCPTCGEPLDICPECIINGKIVRTIAGTNVCAECGWNGGGLEQHQQIEHNNTNK